MKRTFSALGVSLLLFSRQATGLTLEDCRGIYLQSLTSITNESQKQITGVLASYGEALSALRSTYARSGDDKSIEMVTQELDRLAGENTLPKSLPARLPEVIEKAKEAKEMIQAKKAEEDRKLLVLSERYLKALKTCATDPALLKDTAEVRRLQEELTRMDFIVADLAASEASRRDSAPKVAAAVEPLPVAAASPAAEVSTPTEPVAAPEPVPPPDPFTPDAEPAKVASPRTNAVDIAVMRKNGVPAQGAYVLAHAVGSPVLVAYAITDSGGVAELDLNPALRFDITIDAPDSEVVQLLASRLRTATKVQVKPLGAGKQKFYLAKPGVSLFADNEMDVHVTSMPVGGTFVVLTVANGDVAIGTDRADSASVKLCTNSRFAIKKGKIRKRFRVVCNHPKGFLIESE